MAYYAAVSNKARYSNGAKPPSLAWYLPLCMVTINALAAADSVIIPVQAHYLPAKGMTQLLQTIARVRRQINPKLTIEGVLLTMVDKRTNFAKNISFILRRDYGDKLRVFQAEIPLSIRAAETSAEGKSIYVHDPHGIAAKAYQSFTRRCKTLAKSNTRDSIKLTSVDDLFSTEESRVDSQREKALEITLTEISNFPNHPFKVKADEGMLEMADSVKQYGVLVPGLVRPKAISDYQRGHYVE